MEMVNSEVRVITGRVLHVTPDDLRNLANQMELASKTAGVKGKVMVELVEGFVLTYDPLLKVTKVKPEKKLMPLNNLVAQTANLSQFETEQ